MGINEKAVSRVKLKTKAPYTKCHTGSTQTVELELGVTWTKELSYGDSKAERGEAQARAERNYKRKRAALAPCRAITVSGVTGGSTCFILGLSQDLIAIVTHKLCGDLRGVVWAVCCMVLYSCMLIQRCMALYGCMAPGGRRDEA